MQGLQLKRNGIDVSVLEQDPSKDRHSHESGVSIGPSVIKVLERYDATGRPFSIPARFLNFAWRKYPRVFSLNWAHNMSNWGCLYLVLRANFDGLPSEAVPEPPLPKPGEGKVDYQSGKRVTKITYDKVEQRAQVQFQDVLTGETDSLSADLVIAADGVHSTARQLLTGSTRKIYAGYIAWRGTVPEHVLSYSTIDYFSNKLNFSLINGSYFISYHIPTENGRVKPGERLINWVWYYPISNGSAEMAAIFTDIHGAMHANTVPQGLVNPEIWKHQVNRYLDQMRPPLAEVVSKTSRPFVTKVGEAQCDGRPSFYDGRVVLVGDAFTGFRSHLGMASEQAARHCLQMEKVLRGDITQEQYDNEAMMYARKFILLNRCIGFTGLGWIWALYQTLMAYVWLIVAHKLDYR
ncbi:FAD binding domain protein [Apiospora kogelbergensis]|uniref:FAD binding domain protein n=1 Tax=Apiospora kogelbergensis TaxID=1337665 RepID=UPI0031307491